MPGQEWVIWGSALSPFHLKVMAMCRYVGLPFRVLPGERSRLENLRYNWRRYQVVTRRLPLTWPRKTKLDEFPLVPYLFGPGGENLYDSSAIAEWLDTQSPAPRPRGRLIPEEPAAAFVAHLIDEYADEFGLYMAHHMRWVISAKDNDAGRRVAREYRVGPFESLMAEWFSRRQVRRLPYLFSVAPAGFRIDGLPEQRQPPSRPGFPPTHALLNDAFDRLLVALEQLLRARPYVLGSHFTVADASLYGQLGMNLSDPSANAHIQQKAPGLHRWLQRIHAGEFDTAGSVREWQFDSALSPLLAEIVRTYVSLMHQNAAAYERLKAADEICFNERAFNRNQALYEGTLDGHPYRAVVKAFQVRTWRDLCQRWRGLNAASRARVAALMPGGAHFELPPAAD